MAHLSTIENPWGKSFTTKRYLHAPFSENIVTMWPSTMVMIGEISGEDDPHTHYPMHHNESKLPSAAVIFTMQRESDAVFKSRKANAYQTYTWDHDFLPYKATSYKTRKDGVPIHSFVKDMDAIKFHEEAFCDSERVSTVYIKVTLENAFGYEQQIELGVMARTAKEYDLVGEPGPDGYREEIQDRQLWLENAAPYRQEKGRLTDGQYVLYFNDKIEYRFGKVGKGENDLIFPVTLKPYEKRIFTFAFTRNPQKPKSYNAARRMTTEFWQNELAKAQNVPDKKGIEPLFYNFLAQELQMFARPQGKDHVIMRQGGRQRYHWPEAKEMVGALAQIGGYQDYLDKGLAHYFGDLQTKEGENKGMIFYPCVPWISRTGAGLEMLGKAAMNDRALYEKYVDAGMEAYRWIERERQKSVGVDGLVAGLFPPGIASDHHFEDAQQWTCCDAPNVYGIAVFLEMLKKHDSPYVAEVQKGYDEYFGILKGLFDKFAKEQEDGEELYLPRTAQNNPEQEAELNQDAFRYLYPNKALGFGFCGYGTQESEKVIKTYSQNGQMKNGLITPAYRSTTGVGRTWYTSFGEHKRFLYYMKSGNRAEAKKLLDSQLKYNVTTEYYQGERYDDHNAYVVPWLPNASANGRLLMMLFDYYGAKKL